jgi:hypothetical protein
VASVLVATATSCSISERCYELLFAQSQERLKADLAERATIPAPVLEVWRLLNDEKDQHEGLSLMNRERLLPLEHSDLNDIESSEAQKRIRQVHLQSSCYVNQVVDLHLPIMQLLQLIQISVYLFQFLDSLPACHTFQELAELLAAIQKEVQERIAEEKAQGMIACARVRMSVCLLPGVPAVVQRC